MNLGTRVGLAVIGLFVGVLVVYYGFVMPTDPPAAEIEVAVAEPEPSAPIETPAITERTLETTPAPMRTPPTTPRTAVPAPVPDVRSDPIRERLPAASPTVHEAAPVSPEPTPATPMPSAPETKPKPRPRPADVPPRPEYEKYTVAEGDTMSSIAEMWFGEAAKWDLIAKANPRIDPAKLKIGQELRLPARATRRGERLAVAGKYVIRPGDTLTSIALALYGDRGAWGKLYDANRRLIGDDPGALVVGMELRVPARD